MNQRPLAEVSTAQRIIGTVRIEVNVITAEAAPLAGRRSACGSRSSGAL